MTKAPDMKQYFPPSTDVLQIPYASVLCASLEKLNNQDEYEW